MSVFRNLLMSIEETPPTPSRRHIQIGDILKDKKLYFDFPDDIRLDSYFIQYTTNYYVASWNVEQVSPNNSDVTRRKPSIWVRPVTSYNNNFFIYVGEGSRNQDTQVYSYVNGVLTINLTELDLSTVIYNQYLNTPIAWIDTNNPAYEHIWIDNE